MWQFETEFAEIIRRAPDVKSFRFKVRNKKLVQYKAGQFFFVTIKIDNREAVHHFTLSSSPTETARDQYVEFTKRITASEYTQALDRMQPGGWARLRGAEGDFTLPARQRKIAFLSGGIGITPLRSMLRYIADKKLSYDVVLLYGNTSFDTIVFREELDDIVAGSEGKVRVEYVLSGPEFPAGWQGPTGYIRKDLITELIPDYRERIFFLSGPLKMVLALEEQLELLGVSQEQTKRDYFPGYD